MAKSETTRRFLLEKENYTSKEDKQFYNYALRAYLKGAQFFRFKGQHFPTPTGQ